MAKKDDTGSAALAEQPKSIAERATANLVEIGGKKYTVKKQVTLPVLKQVDGETYTVRFESKIFEAPALKPGRDGVVKGDTKLPPMIAHVADLTTGELRTLICNAALCRELENGYPDATYIGKVFSLRSTLVAMKGGQGERFRDYQIVELEAE